MKIFYLDLYNYKETTDGLSDILLVVFLELFWREGSESKFMFRLAHLNFINMIKRFVIDNF